MPRFLLGHRQTALFRLVPVPENRERAPSLNGALDSGSSMAPIEINGVLGSHHPHVAIYLLRAKLMGSLLILDEVKIFQ